MVVLLLAKSRDNNDRYPLVNIQKAIVKMAKWLIYLVNMVMFHTYVYFDVSLPEGRYCLFIVVLVIFIGVHDACIMNDG